MLLWERLSTPVDRVKVEAPSASRKLLRTHRLPYDRQCVAITKAGRRCRGRIREGQDFCLFHDPSINAEGRRRNAAKGGRSHHPLAHLPEGYLRRLTSRRGLGDAMDRLYRELRLGLVTIEMATVLFNILTRLLDSVVCDANTAGPRSSGRSKADQLRPRIDNLLTRAEQIAWRDAVAAAPSAFRQSSPPQAPTVVPRSRPQQPPASPRGPARVALPAAS